MESDIGGYALKNGEGTHINFRGTKIVVKASGERSEGAYTLLEMTHQPNVGPALHIHPKAPEEYYVLKGEYSIRYGEKTVIAKAGDFIFIPKGMSHNYQSGPEGGKVLVISPAGLERYFAGVADVLKERLITGELEQEIAGKYGQEFLDGLKHWGQ
ncbi:cupin domain-containing protein [Nitrososphaera viennensis]|nr:cupin domain-containing protein [Nitrososphaera viennensis]UVS69644.1 cupin domain-containing protein [Nitrososphaera viennensis]